MNSGMLRRVVSAVSVPLASVALLLAPGAAGADQSLGEIVNARGKCLEVYNWSTANRAKVDQWTCYNDSNQRWIARHVGSDIEGVPTYEILNAHSGKCLEVYNWAQNSGANLDQWTCFGLDANQQWQFTALSTINKHKAYKLVNLNSSDVLDIAGNSTKNGVRAIQVDQGNWNDTDSWWHCTVRCVASEF